jgi:hypothetical protein
MRKLFVLLAALVSFDASAASVWAALYGVEETFEFEIWSSDGLTLDVDETDDGNDVLVQCDQDAAAESTNTYTDEGSHYAVVLTAAELDCQYITVHINETVANVFYIQTYGHASAMVASFAQTGDSFARIGANGAGLSAIPDLDTVLSIMQMAAVQACDSGTETTCVDAARTEATSDYWKGTALVVLSGSTAGQSRCVVDFNTNDTITVSPAFTAALSTNSYILVRDAVCTGVAD